MISNPGILLKIGVKQQARYMIIAHNAPSGYLDPDIIKLTYVLFDHATNYDLIIKDHIVITYEGYWSMHGMGHLNTNHKL
jgi:DNA repair protein RadC